MKVAQSWFGYSLLCIAVWIALLPTALAANNFIPIRLPHEVQIEIPRNWEALEKISGSSSIQPFSP